MSVNLISGNEADFLGVLQKSVPHESLTLPFEPFQFRLHDRKTTPRLGESANEFLKEKSPRR